LNKQFPELVLYVDRFFDSECFWKCLQVIIADIPAPLAAKTYYSQRNNRLRAAISFMYHQKSTGECPAEEREPQGNLVTWEPLTKVSSDEQSDDCSKKVYNTRMPFVD